MEVEFKYIVPIIGVALGWLLSQLAGLFTFAREDRRIRSSSLPAMLDLYFQQKRIDHVLTYFNVKLGDSIEQLHTIFEKHDADKESRLALLEELITAFEKTRQGNLDLPEKNKENLESSIDHAIKELSKVDAVSSYRLTRLYNEFILLIEIKFPDEDLNSPSYLKTWSELLSIYRADLESLRNLVLKTARGVGVIGWYKVWSLIREEEKQLESTPKDTLDSVLTTLKPNKSSQQDAASVASA
jgi:hypothetical protein